MEKVDIAPLDVVRKTIIKCKDKRGIVTIKAVARELVLYNDDYKVLMRRVISLGKRGELERVSKGVYRWTSKKQAEQSPRDRIWTVIRAKKIVTYAEIQELAGVERREVVSSYMFMLKKFGYVKRISKGNAAKYRLVKDPVKRPVVHYHNKTEDK